MNTAYIIAVIFACAAGYLLTRGVKLMTDDDRCTDEVGMGVIVIGVISAIVTCIFAGVGLNIQYFQ